MSDIDYYIGIFEDELGAVSRDGIDKLLAEANESDFYAAPASTKFHGTDKGDLLRHSVEVFLRLQTKVVDLGLDEEVTQDEVRICGLLHDWCKKGVYKECGDEATEKQKSYLRSLLGKTGIRLEEDIDSMSKNRASGLIDHIKNRPNKPLPEKEVEWSYEETEPLGHGEKSVIMLQEFIPLTSQEKAAIRWHMVAFNPGIHFDYPQGFPFQTAVEEFPLVTLLFTSDFEVSNIIV